MTKPIERAARKRKSKVLNKAKAEKKARAQEYKELASAVAAEILASVSNENDRIYKRLSRDISALALASSKLADSNGDSLKQFNGSFRELIELASAGSKSDEELNKAVKSAAKAIQSVHDGLNALEFTMPDEISLSEAVEIKDIKAHVDRIISAIDKAKIKEVAIAYREMPPSNYINVRITNGMKFIDTFGGGGGGGGAGFQAGTNFDSLSIVNTDTDEDTLTYAKGGDTIRTLVIGYAAGAEKVSDSLSSLDYN